MKRIALIVDQENWAFDIEAKLLMMTAWFVSL